MSSSSLPVKNMSHHGKMRSFHQRKLLLCQQKRWERMAWPCRCGIQVSSLSLRSTLPCCVDELEHPFSEPCLPVPGGCLPFLVALSLSPARQGQCPHRHSHGTPCSVSCSGLAGGTPGWPPGRPLARGTPCIQLPAALSPRPVTPGRPRLFGQLCLLSLGTAGGTGKPQGGRGPRGGVGRGLGDRAAQRPARLRRFPSPAPPAHLLPLCHSSGQTDAPK